MRSLHIRSVLSLSLLFSAASCAGAPANNEPEFPVMPQPLMETGKTGNGAMPNKSTAVEPVSNEPMSNEPVLAMSEPIAHEWTDQFARRWTASFRIVYGTDESHEMLADACIQASWPQTVEIGRTMLEQVDLTDTEQVDAWREQLCQDLEAMLFPCTNGLPVGNVVGIEWVSRRTR
jgi:Txe/YoeB family toxin of Txe-Axe toxin-antitoxin module